MGIITETVVKGIEGTVSDSNDEERTPATDGYEHRTGSAVDVNAGTAEESLTAPDRAQVIAVHVDDWGGAGHVEVQFLDSADGSAVTQRDHNDRGAYSTDGTTDVYVTAEIMSPWIRVRIVDDSGAANTVDYNVYAR